MVEMNYRTASEHQLVVFQKIVAVFVDIDLKSLVERVFRKFVVVGECDDVVAEFG